MGLYVKPVPFIVPKGLSKEWRTVFEQLAKTLLPLWKQPLLDMTLVEGVTMRNSTVLVSHGLGRKWRGWYVVDTLEAYPVCRSNSATALAADPTLYLPLVAPSAAAPFNVSLVVF